MSSTYLTVDDICKRFGGISERTVLGWISSGELKAVNVGRKPGKKKPRWRISQEALDEFERGRSAMPKPQSAPRRRAEVVDMYP
jgi:excisionase family DNA binding protein